MEELIEQLKKSCDNLELISELTLKYKDIQVVGQMLFYKELEEGILNKLMNANEHQLEIMKSSYNFRYYKKEITITIKKESTSTALSTKIVPTNLSAGTFSYLDKMVHFKTSPKRGNAKLAR